MMIIRLWHEALVSYSLNRYNLYSDKDHEKRSVYIKKAFYHQEKILDIKVARHNKSS